MKEIGGTPVRARPAGRATRLWHWVLGFWNRTPGYLKWLGGLLLGALVRLVFARLFPERWERVSHRLFDPTIPVWLALVILALVLLLERMIPSLYHRVRSARAGQVPLRTLFGVRWALPADGQSVQGPYCTDCTIRLRGTLWSGDSSPTLWTCPSCGREFSTPEFPDIGAEVERRLRPRES